MALGKKREMKKTKVEIIPMIDTMFFLLVFFILSSVGVIKLQGLNIDLPTSAPSTPSTPQKPDKKVELNIVIDKSEKITVDNRPTPSDDIRPLLQREIDRQAGGPGSDPSKASVIISADPVARQGTVVRCIDQARDMKISNFAIATSVDGGPGGIMSAVPATVGQ